MHLCIKFDISNLYLIQGKGEILTDLTLNASNSNMCIINPLLEPTSHFYSLESTMILLLGTPFFLKREIDGPALSMPTVHVAFV